MFCKTIKPIFSKKCTMKEKITLVKNDEIISDCQPVAELSNKLQILYLYKYCKRTKFSNRQ